MLKRLIIISAIILGCVASNHSFSSELKSHELRKQTTKVVHKNGDTTIVESNETGHKVVRKDSKGAIKSQWSGRSGGMTHEQVVKREQFPNEPKRSKKLKHRKEKKEAKVQRVKD
ncbi:hypothetical protein [Aliikangiella coralliicola]|uniref:Uncharacterized protein n=1 Tax=Aliikangiella coralliicola TaxID=2592383 RepID=A0A545U916_9GAMM|nr:hypothetical protein [Aliikangiella coralliicola]TQV85903.1 hypothetical protein FLL46_18445 [Aliikangiella coralliicola]